jgi:hypothetical protein
VASAYLDSDTAHLSGTQTFSGAKTFSADTTTFTSATADSPIIKVLNTTDDDDAGQLIFEKLRDDDGVAQRQDLGEIWFRGQDNAQNTQDYANVFGEIDVSTGGQESGKLTLSVASHDGDVQSGLTLVGGDVDQEVDVGLGSGAASTTVIAGTLTMGSTAFVNNSGVIQVATQGTIDHDSLANFVANEHIDWTGSSAGTIHSSNIPTLNQSTTGQAATVATIAGLAPNTATTQATQPNITTLAGVSAIGTAGTPITITSDTVTFQSANADDPIVTIKNTSNDTNEMASLKFVKDRGAAPDVGTNLAEIYFIGEDSGQNEQEYGRILSEIDVATHGQESGVLKFGVANHDGGNGYGLIMTGGSANDEVDVTLGLGAASVVTIPGDIDLAGDIDVDGTLEADAITLGGTALNSLYSPIAGSENIESVGTIGEGTWEGTVIASSHLDADTMHYSAQRQLTHHTIKDDIGTGVVYISLGEIDAESGTKSNKNLPLLAPVAGKLLKVFLRTVEDMSASGHNTNLTWRLLTRAATATTTGNATVIGTQTGAGPTGSSMATYDFTSSLDSGTNAIVAGDKVQLSVQSDAASADSLFFITCLWEWDLS